MKSVKKVLRKTLPRYNLRSNPVYHSSSPKVKVNSSVQVDLSQEEISALFEELPFQVSPSDDELPEDSACPSILNYSTVPPPRSSTAFSTLDQADVTTREPLDISLDSSSESLVYPSVRETASPTSPPDSPEFDPADLQSFVYRTPQQAGPARIALQVENISDFDDLEEPREGEENQPKSTPSQPPVINTPADLVKLVPRRSINRESDISSGSESTTSEVSEDEDSSSESELTMEAELLRGLQEQVAHLQNQLKAQQLHQQKTTSALEKTPLPESSSTQRPAPFHGYDSEDVSRWLNKIESYLKLRRIDPTSSTALAELSLNLAGPAEDFYYSLPEEQKATFNQLRDALQDRFSNDNQSWLIWQAVSTRQQGSLEPLDTYLTDLTNKFRRLNITDAEKMRYFVHGLRADIRKTVLLKQPKTFREAEEMARLACSVENTMSSAPSSHMAAHLNHLSQAVNSLANVQAASNSQPILSAERKIVSLLEHNNDVLAELRSKLDSSTKPTATSVQTNTTLLNGPPAVAAINEPSGETSGVIHKIRSDLQQLKDLIHNLGRETDARIRGLARRNQPTRSEPPRERTRTGQPVCFSCGSPGHFQNNCPDRRNSGARSQEPQQYRPQGPSRRENNYAYNQPSRRENNYRDAPQRNRTDPRLAVLDDGWSDEDFVAPLEQRNDDLEQFYAVSEPQNAGGIRETRPEVNIQLDGAVRFSNTPLQQQLANLNESPVLPSNAVPELSNGTKPEVLSAPRFGGVREEKSATDQHSSPVPADNKELDPSQVSPEVKSALALLSRTFGLQMTGSGSDNEETEQSGTQRDSLQPSDLARTLTTSPLGVTQIMESGIHSHSAPSHPGPMYFARRSTLRHRENNVISAIKPSSKQSMVRCPTNLHEKIATQHAVMSPSNQKPEQATPAATVAYEKFPAPKDNHATPKPVTDQDYDTSDISVEFKPAFDLFLRAIKQSQTTRATEQKSLSPQIVNIPNATTNKPIDTDVEDCSDELSSEPDQTSVKRKTLKVHDWTPNKVMPALDESSTAQVCPSTTTTSSEKVKKRLPHSDARLHSSDLTTSGVIAGEAVQLLVDTGACLSVIDEKFLQTIYGPFSPKMTDGSLLSIQTVNGEHVPVLGKIAVPIELNGREYACDFHVMQNLAYDAILGRDFLQQNRALIDLDNNNITFKRSGKVIKKARKSTSNLPVLGTFFFPTTSVERQTSTKADLEPRPKRHSPNGVLESQNGNKRVSHYSLLVWVCFVLYLCTASPSVMQESHKPAVQTAQKSLVFHDAINDSAARNNAGVSVHTIGPFNHKEPYKVTRDSPDAPKSRGEPFTTTKTAADILNDSEYALPDGVSIRQGTTVRDLVQESLISVALDLPKDELKIKPSPTLNL